MSILKDLLALREPAPEVVTEAEDLDQDEAKGYAEELEGLHKKIVQCMEDVRHIVHQLPRHMRGTAEAYWVPHIMIALGGEHEWMTARHESTLQKTIDELKEYADDSTQSDDFKDDKEHGDDPMGRHHGRNE
jgi:hypothetical protein